jgi:methionyl-tRNA formyltransferase
LEAGHAVPLVVTQPDRPAGRGMHSAASAVKRTALAHGLALLQPPGLRASDAAAMRAVRPDALVVAAYGVLLPPEILSLAPHGALNIHASLLPRWRGAAPIQRALLAGDRETGISIMRMDAGLDTGPVLARYPLAIAADDDAGSLHDRLAALGAQAIVEAIAALAAGRTDAMPQPAVGVTYARKIGRDDARLDWSRPAVELERVVRAMRPAPGAVAMLDGEPLKIWRARVVEQRGLPGAVLQTGAAIVVGCGEAALAVTELQRAGGRPLAAADFLRGRTLEPGARLQ